MAEGLWRACLAGEPNCSHRPHACLALGFGSLLKELAPHGQILLREDWDGQWYHLGCHDNHPWILLREALTSCSCKGHDACSRPSLHLLQLNEGFPAVPYLMGIDMGNERCVQCITSSITSLRLLHCFAELHSGLAIHSLHHLLLCNRLLMHQSAL